jgi:hypothetical protein
MYKYDTSQRIVIIQNIIQKEYNKYVAHWLHPVDVGSHNRIT